MKKAKRVEFGIEIVKPWSKAMYDHNDEVAEVVKAKVHEMWMDAWNECEREVTDMDEESDLLINMDWDAVATPEMIKIQKAVTIYSFGYGYSVGRVAETVEDDIDDAPYYRLKEIAEDLKLDLNPGFVGLS